MPKFLITNSINKIIEAKDEYEAMIRFEEESNESLENYTEIKEICPHCEEILEPKMVDIDGTNLEEHFICPQCKYGSPTLR